MVEGLGDWLTFGSCDQGDLERKRDRAPAAGQGGGSSVLGEFLSRPNINTCFDGRTPRSTYGRVAKLARFRCLTGSPL